MPGASGSEPEAAHAMIRGLALLDRRLLVDAVAGADAAFLSQL
jgi:hypothetical protein